MNRIHRGRWLLAGVAALLLCSCRAPHIPQAADATAGVADTLPPEAWTGTPAPPGPSFAAPGCPPVPLPQVVTGAWSPPGIACPWPNEEYLCDGGDRGLPVKVTEDWRVLGLELEDTIAHYDTLDGSRCVQPSNRVCLYSPRFGAVRTVSGVELNQQIAGPNGVYKPTQAVRQDELQVAVSSLQNIRPERQVGTKKASGYRMRQGDGMLSTALLPHGFENVYQPFENLWIIRHGILEQSDKAWLAKGTAAAVAWTNLQAVQVILDDVVAGEVTGDRRVQAVFSVDDTPGAAKLRVIKVASDQTVKPGETVDFTIRFDNVGCSTIGNVTIIDNLTTRLEYVPDSAQSSLAADFSTQPNDGDSLVLRWEIADPIKPGDGGVVRFQCRVR